MAVAAAAEEEEQRLEEERRIAVPVGPGCHTGAPVGPVLRTASSAAHWGSRRHRSEAEPDTASAATFAEDSCRCTAVEFRDCTPLLSAQITQCTCDILLVDNIFTKLGIIYILQYACICHGVTSSEMYLLVPVEYASSSSCSLNANLNEVCKRGVTEGYRHHANYSLTTVSILSVQCIYYPPKSNFTA